MSVYPKKILKGENVNIHINVFNRQSRGLEGNIEILIFLPKNELIKTILFDFKCKGHNNIDYFFKYKAGNIRGKYKIIAFINVKNKKYLSETYKEDYFIVN